jgi:hypothetical protein
MWKVEGARLAVISAISDLSHILNKTHVLKGIDCTVNGRKVYGFFVFLFSKQVVQFSCGKVTAAFAYF